MSRIGKLERKTGETDIKVDINLDGSGKYFVDTGIGFLDHMLELFAKHGNFDLDVKAKGDLNVDCHHTVEDVAIGLGCAINKALKKNIKLKRYATAYTPMDETLSFISLDISGRPYLVFNGEFTVETIGDLDTEMIEEFFRSLVYNSKITGHFNILYGKNNHHKAESLFKGFGRALKEAVIIEDTLLSTKGSIEV
ncbi:MAG: imidazoleglycerol-phosphate dehydratase HisB [Anaeromicrobium sp.]|jgi:imidazoleglycerol-phosphate dehydratase|uniref:imidazoleglycerol-phosphate dehydratase HisB n=1 Tax=Anaeromicrobium sp. TaxID=1929132 RepID=UPI0025DECF63|nr:imidazoleglycerol-phosphate dehydratase HisB [Anaeromicrobium sp.]MCT4593894.1 imidazoleglycerol-phosphate dehydratase HisB [Anaeromicrobium sp.]